MLELMNEYEQITTWVITLYFLIIPFFCNIAWQESKQRFIKWYFTKSDSVNWLGFSIFLLIGSGCFIWYIGYLILTLIFYIIILPLCWLLEFIFLNKDCSHIVCKELNNKKEK